MKITRIYLKNLNSLRGEFTINLEQEPFSSSGIFAITGPTGAGKTTILDAITLALYGRAARYDSKPNPENMMSRGTGECHAEVEFEVPQGRYRASWQMKRARGKADGKLQPVQRFVYNSQGATLAQKSSEVDKIIEELTGLDVDSFFRSVLLAQGDFVKFLKATPDDRATLLESLTGTGIYSEISIRAHEETTKNENALKLKEKDLGNIKLFSDEERTALLHRINSFKAELEANTQKLAKLMTLIQQGNDLAKNLKRQAELMNELVAINHQLQDSESDFNRLNLHRKTAPFLPELSHLDHLQSDIINIKQIANIKKYISELTTTRSKKREEFELLDKWLESNQKDQTLELNLNAIVEQITSLIHLRNKTKEINGKIESLRKDLVGAEFQINLIKVKKEETLFTLMARNLSAELNEKKYREILREHTIEQIQQEIAQLIDRLTLHTHRDKLEHGKSCPLCGSLEHPFTESVSETESEFQLDTYRTQLKNAQENRLKKVEIEKSIATARHEVELAQNTLSSQEKTMQSIVKQIESSNAELHHAQAEILNLETTLLKLLKPYDISIPSYGIEKNALKNLEERKKTYQKNEKLFSDLKIELNNLDITDRDLEVYSKAELTLSEKLVQTPFQNIEGLRSSLLSTPEILRIQSIEEAIKTHSVRNHNLLAQVELDLANLATNNTPQGKELLDVQARHFEISKHTNQLRGDIAVAESNLRQDDHNCIQHAVLLKELDVDRKQLSIWQKLSSLIGSHDGKAFRKFAQGLSLDLLIKHANKHLSLLSNRYRLKRIVGELLDLEIQDLHQANATRPTASLSGGESFLTSLALALGLSDLAGKNVRIDSLFIDEGFGSLDPEALEIAVQALESLRAKNKTIGVISHIELLKERISTQIIIEKGSGGISTMSFSS